MNQIDGSIVGELLLGEIEEWHVGVCTLRVDDDDCIVVRGEGDVPVARIGSDWYRLSILPGGGREETKDLGFIADKVNRAIRMEHAEL